MRFLVCLAAAVLFASTASAQLVAVRFKDPKAANRYKEHLVPFQGALVVVGEPWTNLKADPITNKIEYVDPTNHYIELLKADGSDPTKLPYKLDGDEKKLVNSKVKVGISTDDVDNYAFYMREGSLQSLAVDYSDRRDQIDGLRAQRDLQTKGGPQWMSLHQRMLQQMERLETWLSSGLFVEAGEKLEKELAKERKVVAAEATAVRLESAKASIKMVEPDEKLKRLAQEIAGGSETFKVQQSTHCRIIYRDGIDELRVHELLVMAEEIINGWRVDFVDPYLDAGYEDYIEEKIFGEWFFAYDDIPHSEKYMTAYYGMGFDPKTKEETLQTAGHGHRRSIGASYVYFWRAEDNADLEGIVAHNIGHMLAGIHFDKGRLGLQQDWLEEGCGLYVSLEWLGRNSVNCKAFAKEGVYAHEKKKAGEKTAQVGLRDWYNAVAIESGAAIDRLALRTLFEMGDGDLAKSWSFFDWMAKKCGKEGQLFLRAECNLSRSGKTFIPDWRKKAEELFEIRGKDAFDVLDARWKEYAQAGQDTGDTKKK